MLNDSKEPCTLTGREANEMLFQQRQQSKEIAELTGSFKKEISDIKEDLAEINRKVDNLRLLDASRVGYVKGANMWFRVGAWATIAAIGAGAIFVISIIIALLTGKVDITPLLKQL